MKETIFAEATARGKAGVSIFRISGPKAGDSLLHLGFKELPAARQAVLKRIKNKKGEIIDQALVIFMKGPNSFTGEDVAEIHLHGSRAVAAMLTEALLEVKGLRPAEAGEFTRAALLNGKMDLTEVEGLADLLAAETKQQQKQALRQMQGELSKLYEAWRKDIIEALAFLEAYIDFPDEDLPRELVGKLQKKISDLKIKIEKHLDDNFRGEILRRGLQIAILGAPNTGKSTLLNYLARRDVAIVSETPGTTRDVIEVNLDLGGYKVTVFDTAGIRESADVIEAEGVRRALDKAGEADFKIVMFDAANSPYFPKESLALLDKDAIAVINKCDGDNTLNRHSSESRNLIFPARDSGFCRNGNAVFISLKEKTGLDELLRNISNILETTFGTAEGPAITRERHRRLLKETVPHLEKFLDPDIFRNIELAAQELWISANNIGKITGKIDIEDVLDELFRNFCIGK